MAVEDRLDKLDSILGTVNSGYESQARMMAKAQLQEEAFIKKLAQLNKVSEQEIKAKLDLLEAQKKQQKYEEDREKAIAEGIKKVLGGLQQFASGAISSSQSIYTSESAFTSVIPTINLLGNAVKSVTSALSSMFSGIPFLGAAIAGLDKVTAVAVDISIQVGQMMLENAQRYVDTYNSLSKVGVTFGGNLRGLQEAAKDGGMSLDQYNKFVTGNIESLSAMGGTVQQASHRIMLMGKRALENNENLLVMYGSYDAVNGALAQYADLVSKTGVNTRVNQEQLKAGAADYLVKLKELTSLTGMSADQYKKETEERLKHAAFQNKIAEMRANGQGAQADQLLRQVALISRTYGKNFADLAEESIANNGVIISKSGIQLNAFTNGLAMDVITPLIKAARGTEEEWKTGTVAAINANEQAVSDFRKRGSEMSGLMYGTNNESVKLINDITAGLTNNLDKRQGIETAFTELSKQRNAVISAETAEYKKLLEKIKEFKIGMDENVIASFTKVANIASTMVDFNKTLIDQFGPTFGTAVEKFAGAVQYLVNKLTGKIETASTAGMHPETAGRVRAEEAVEQAELDRKAAVEKHGAASEEAKALRIAEANARREAEIARAREQTAQRQRFNQANQPGGGVKNNAAAGAAAPTNLAPLGQMTSNYGDLTPLLRGAYPGEATQGGQAEQRLVDAISKLLGAPGVTIRAINAMNDKWHKDKASGSLHTKGRAADLNIAELNDPKTRQATLDTINQILKGIAKAEIHKNAEGNGEHVHVQLMKNGGPLGPGDLGIVGEDGRPELVRGPANVTGVNDTAKLFASMVNHLEELVKVNKDQLGGLDKIYRVSA